MILINPASRRMGIFSEYAPISIPIGIGCLAAYLLEKGENVTIHDENIKLLDESGIESLVNNESKPYIFGFSSMTAGISRAMELARLVKNKFPDSRIIMGGIHPTVMPEEPLNDSPTDAVVIGQGEIASWELVKAFRAGETIENIKSIAYKRGEEIIRTPRNPLLSLSDLPDFPYHLFEKNKERYDFPWMISSLGCPYDCIFCSQRAITGREVRYTDNEKVIRQIILLADRYHCDHVGFCDDNLIINKERIIDLCNRIIEKGLHKKMYFECQARGDAVNDEVLSVMKKANFRSIFFGIETASERLMKLIKKDETLEQIISGIRLAQKYGFIISATFILGLPTETKEERRAAYKLAKELDLDYARFNNATPYPGTELYKIAKQEGRLNPGKDWKYMNAVLTLVDSPFKPSPLAYVPSTTTEGELRKDILRSNLLFSLQPKSVMRYIKGSAQKGAFALPKGWYYHPKELLVFFRFAFQLLGSFIRIIF